MHSFPKHHYTLSQHLRSCPRGSMLPRKSTRVSAQVQEKCDARSDCCEGGPHCPEWAAFWDSDPLVGEVKRGQGSKTRPPEARAGDAWRSCMVSRLARHGTGLSQARSAHCADPRNGCYAAWQSFQFRVGGRGL